MLPDEAADAAVLQDCLEGAIWPLIHSCGAMDGHVVNVGNVELRNLWLKDMCDIIMENRNSIGPTHGQLRKAECTIRRLEHCIIVR